jgi:hypothetical protein
MSTSSLQDKQAIISAVMCHVMVQGSATTNCYQCCYLEPQPGYAEVEPSLQDVERIFNMNVAGGSSVGKQSLQPQQHFVV